MLAIDLRTPVLAVVPRIGPGGDLFLVSRLGPLVFARERARASLQLVRLVLVSHPIERGREAVQHRSTVRDALVQRVDCVADELLAHFERFLGSLERLPAS